MISTKRVYEFRDDCDNYTARAIAKAQAEFPGRRIEIEHVTSGLVAVIVEIRATTIEESN